MQAITCMYLVHTLAVWVHPESSKLASRNHWAIIHRCCLSLCKSPLREKQSIDNKLIKALKWVSRVSFEQKAFVFLSRVVQQRSQRPTPNLGSAGFIAFPYGHRKPLFHCENSLCLSLLWPIIIRTQKSALVRVGVTCRRGLWMGLACYHHLVFHSATTFRFLTANIPLKWLNQVRVVVFKLPLACTSSKHRYTREFMLWDSDWIWHTNKP